ncbi:3-hydroxyacyl-CoA dehydrogenase NAD-binding domain-containing protein [Arthrobacter sp. PsM3]|nr:3-hydroxyacyl-CoA dehydrogenase NAD-binding domain-containing protein [Arthrobacter sp. PsM3]MDN4642740.1 3-hydroxyacyl-CoA dehydrogenase NAD-binding domain-containing protein [Arthrobacter sp. PsM3]
MTYTLPANIAERPITVIGGGTLGRRIALMLSLQGAEVRVYDTDLTVAKAAIEYIATQRHRAVEELGGNPAVRLAARDNLADALRDSWLVVEAVPKSLASSRQSSLTLTSWPPRTPCWPATLRRSLPRNSLAE